MVVMAFVPMVAIPAIGPLLSIAVPDCLLERRKRGRLSHECTD
jgi:hypothetical protein